MCVCVCVCACVCVCVYPPISAVVQALQRSCAETNCVSFSPDGTQLATGNDLCQVQLWDFKHVKVNYQQLMDKFVTPNISVGDWGWGGGRGRRERASEGRGEEGEGFRGEGERGGGRGLQRGGGRSERASEGRVHNYILLSTLATQLYVSTNTVEPL